jgi:anti-sigma factor RsiW
MSVCPTFRDLSAMIDGAVPREQDLALRRHVDGCATCRRWVNKVNALKQAVGCAYGGNVPSPGLRQTVRAGLSKRRRWWWWAGVVAGPFLLATTPLL